MSIGWERAADRLRLAMDEGSSLCRPFVEAFPITGAAISTIGGPLSPTTICASDATARHLDDVQIGLGEGPCWDAVELGRVISVPDLTDADEARWPAFGEAIHGYSIAAVFAFPLRVGKVKVGAIDLYSERPRRLGRSDLRDAESLAGMAAHEVFRRAVESAGATTGGEDELARTIVHQATGMVIAQLDVGPEDAALVLRGRAFSTGRPIREIARDVVERRLDFSRPESDS